MKNYEKYKTIEEKVINFDLFCRGKDCSRCVFNKEKNSKYCQYRWLELEVDETPKRRPYTYEEAKTLLGKTLEVIHHDGSKLYTTITKVHCDGETNEVRINDYSVLRLIEDKATINNESVGILE